MDEKIGRMYIICDNVKYEIIEINFRHEYCTILRNGFEEIYTFEELGKLKAKLSYENTSLESTAKKGEYNEN